MTMREAVAALQKQALAMQLQAGAMADQCEGLLRVMDGQAPGGQSASGCQHPKDRLADLTTMGDGPAKKLCLVCNTEVEA